MSVTLAELQLLNLLQRLHTPVLDSFMKAVSWLGNGGMIWILLTAALLLIPKTRKSGMILAAAVCVDTVLCNLILKNLVARPRPFDVNTAVRLLIPGPEDYSFPSGHTAAAFASFMALFLAGERRLCRPVLALAILIAISRMYLYVHYPTDILGGILVGMASGYAGFRLCVRLFRRKNA